MIKFNVVFYFIFKKNYVFFFCGIRILFSLFICFCSTILFNGLHSSEAIIYKVCIEDGNQTNIQRNNLIKESTRSRIPVETPVLYNTILKLANNKY